MRRDRTSPGPSSRIGEAARRPGWRTAFCGRLACELRTTGWSARPDTSDERLEGRNAWAVASPARRIEVNSGAMATSARFDVLDVLSRRRAPRRTTGSLRRWRKLRVALWRYLSKAHRCERASIRGLGGCSGRGVACTQRETMAETDELTNDQTRDFSAASCCWALPASGRTSRPTNARKIEEGALLGHELGPIALLDDPAVGDVDLREASARSAPVASTHDHIGVLDRGQTVRWARSDAAGKVSTNRSRSSFGP